MATTDAAPAITQGINAAPDEVGKKVFVGNLAFATTPEELKSLFGGIGPIKESQIISRNTRSLGYGFVTFEKADDATAAIQKFDKHTVADRTINVELAKPDRVDKVAKAAARAAGETAPAAEGVGQAKPKRVRKPRNRAPRPDGEADSPAVVAGENGVAPTAGTGVGAPKKRRNRAKNAIKTAVEGAATAVAGATGTTTAGTATASAATNGARPVKQARASRPKTIQGPPSDNKIFVANLPFSIDNAALTKFFEENGFDVVEARIATRRVYPKAPKPAEGGAEEGEKVKRPAPVLRSKGFGFVTLKGKSDQEKALKELDGKEVGGQGEEKRNVQLKVANERVEEEDGEGGVTAEGTETKEKPAKGTEVAV